MGLVSSSTPGPAPLPKHPFADSPHASAPASSTVAPAGSSVPKAPVEDALEPDELSIPSLGVLAPVYPESISTYSLEIPGNVKDVGMWTGGGRIYGSNGTVLLAGHINWYNQGNGALYDLSNIQPGAVIYLSGSSGSPTAWKAVSLEAYPKAQLPQGIFAPTGPRRLAIVTCGGAFDPATGHYADNVVVIAAPIAPAST
ncbi:MAG: class F sortase [Actinomycetota bacterium]|nr:class F sortase [Actinomycetota bacterium]